MMCVVFINVTYSDIYALCEAFPKSYAETLYKETRALLLCFVAKLLEVRGQCAHPPCVNACVCDHVMTILVVVECAGITVTIEHIPTALVVLSARCQVP